jgi:D-aminopeptidase
MINKVIITSMNRARIRDLGIIPGVLPTGPGNAITDVEGVLVGQVTVIHDQPHVARTGITAIVPRDKAIGFDNAFAGFHRFNGCGEMAGVQWIEETGLLSSAIALTNTQQVGMVRDALTEFSFSHKGYGPFILPVAAETYDGLLNDMSAPALTKEDVFEAVQSAHAGRVDEGNVGGGTGMTCHEFKGGIGTASRRVTTTGETFTVGALVQANYGARAELRIDGVPVGREIGFDKVPSSRQPPSQPKTSSIIVIIATDAPLLGDQCRRLAQRATTGLARVGGIGQDSSGDLFLAFATGNHVPYDAASPIPVRTIPHSQLNPLFAAVAEAVEESILNALAAAETMTGAQGHIAYALPLDELKQVMAKYRRLD